MPIDVELAFQPARRLAELIRCGELTPNELVEGYLDRIEHLDGKLNSFITVDADGARRAAAAATERARRGEPMGSFDGVPISIKDNTAVAGLRWTSGSAVFADRVAEADDEVVRRLRGAGFVILGKTNMPEFGTSSMTDPMAFGSAHNPWDTGRTPGGSSGGAAAALAAALCPVSHGNDGGGSVRIPAALCGVVGLKPSRGRVTAAPQVPNLFSTEGVLGRDVADAAAVLDVIAGPAVGDPWWAPPPQATFAEAAAAGVDPMRIALCTTAFIDGIETGFEQRASAHRVAELLAGAGHHVEEASPPWDPTLLDQAILYAATEIALRLEGTDTSKLEPFTSLLLAAGAGAEAETVLRSTDRLLTGCRSTIAWFAQYDALLTPTVARPAPPVGALASLSDPTEMLAVVGGLAAFTGVWNFTGQPAITLPTELDGDGMPLAVQLVGRPAGEERLLALATQLESVLGWSKRSPMA